MSIDLKEIIGKQKFPKKRRNFCCGGSNNPQLSANYFSMLFIY